MVLLFFLSFHSSILSNLHHFDVEGLRVNPSRKDKKGDPMKKSVFIFIAVFITASVMMFTAGAEEKKALTGNAAFVASKCTVCHKIEKVCAQVEVKNPEQWSVTVKRMASKGTGISEVDQKQIVSFLSNPIERKALCPE